MRTIPAEKPTAANVQHSVPATPYVIEACNNYDHHKAASEATDADERLLIPGFKRTKPPEKDMQVVPCPVETRLKRVRQWTASLAAKRPDKKRCVYCGAPRAPKHVACASNECQTRWQTHAETKFPEPPADADAAEALDQLNQANEGDQ